MSDLSTPNTSLKLFNITRELVKVRYYDHVEFKKYDFFDVSPQLREVVGWLTAETDDYIVILYEKPVSEDLKEISKLKPSGFIILKSTIEEVKRIE